MTTLSNFQKHYANCILTPAFARHIKGGTGNQNGHHNSNGSQNGHQNSQGNQYGHGESTGNNGGCPPPEED